MWLTPGPYVPVGNTCTRVQYGSFDQECNSIGLVVPKPGPNAVWSFETCLNLHFPSSQVVLKSQLSFELHPRVSTTSASTTPTLAPTEHLTRSVAGLSPLILLIPLGSLRCTSLDLQRASLTGCLTPTTTNLPAATNAKMRQWNLPTSVQESATLR